MSRLNLRQRAVLALVTALACTVQATAATQRVPAAPSAVASEENPPAELLIANRYVVTLRADSYGASPAERVAAVRDRVDGLVRRGGPLLVGVRGIPEGRAIEIDGVLAFRILPGDLAPDSGSEIDAAAQAAAIQLQVAVAERREAVSAGHLGSAIARALLATVALALALLLLRVAYRRVAARVRASAARRRVEDALGAGGRMLGRDGAASLVTAPLRMLCWLIALGLAYAWAGYVLRRFPYTRPWGEALRENLVHALAGFGSKLLHAVPGLLFVVLILLISRLVVRIVRSFFDGIHKGRLRVGWVDEATAKPTEKLVTTSIWLFAIVAAYPYIPGSGSEAFKGIGVFVGLMLSIGASGIVNQAVSGLMLMYTRVLRPGEFVQIGEYEGVVRSVGFVNTRLESLRHEEISIPNAVVAASTTRNYSRLSGDGGLRLATRLTIGYDTPWRQVQALLMLAADRSVLIAKEPAPLVLQTALQDFYVEYTLLIAIAEPTMRLAALNELHGHVQDVFNEFGVQIMSPNYEADPAAAKVVPREQWFAAPARPDPPVEPRS